MKLTSVKVLDAELSKGHRFWWVGGLYYADRSIEVTQATPMSLTRDDAMAHARDFANRIGAGFIEPEKGTP